MPTVVSSRALVPIGRRIRNAPEDSDASKAIVLRRKQDGETEDLSKALIIRPADDGKDDRQALVLYRKKGGQEALKELADWHKSSALLPPFRLDELLRISDSQFMSCLNELRSLQDPLYFHDDILETIHATREYVIFKEKGGNDPLQNQNFVTSIIASRIHNAYFRTAAWKYVRDHAKLLKDMGLEDLNVYAQLKGKEALALVYLEAYQMLKLIEASGQHELGLVATASPHYMKHFQEVNGNLVWDSQEGYKLHKSLVDTIIIEMIFPQGRYELSILMLCLRDAITAGDDKTTNRFTQDVFDAIGDLSVTLQLLDMMDAPISASDAKAWRQAQSQNINATFSGLIQSSLSATNHVAGIGSLVVPLTKTKTPATLEKIWETINQTFVARAGMDIDILWGLEDSMNPEPQWSAWALARTKPDDDDAAGYGRALVRKSRGGGETGTSKKKRLAIAAEPTSDGEMPDLVSDSEEEASDEEDYDSDAWSDAESDEFEANARRYYEDIRQEHAKKQAAAAREKSPEERGNPFKTLFRSLKGRFLTKNPILSVEPQAPRAEFDERDEDEDQPSKKKKKKKPKKKTGGGGEDDLPGLLPPYPYKNAPSDMPGLIPLSVASERLKNKQAMGAATSEPKILAKKNNVMLEEVEDADTPKAEGSGSKKKKKKKKKAKKAGEPAEAEEEEEEEPRPQTPPPKASPAAAKSPQSRGTPKSPKQSKATPTSPTPRAASASTSSLYTPAPETAQSGRAYMKSEGIDVKTKAKSRPLGKLGDFMSRTFRRGRDEEEEDKAPTKEEDETKVPSGVAERLASYMKSIKPRAIPTWQRILGMDESKGQTGLDWNEFVKAMTDLGFEYDESSAGSRVRFDPPDRKDKSYTVHKPHPDPWLHPRRVKAIARDLRKIYGFDESMLAGLTKETE